MNGNLASKLDISYNYGLGNICKIRIIILYFELITFLYCIHFVYEMNCMTNVMKYGLSLKAQFLPIPSFCRHWDLTERFKFM